MAAQGVRLEGKGEGMERWGAGHRESGWRGEGPGGKRGPQGVRIEGRGPKGGRLEGRGRGSESG